MGTTDNNGEIAEKAIEKRQFPKRITLKLPSSQISQTEDRGLEFDESTNFKLDLLSLFLSLYLSTLASQVPAFNPQFSTSNTPV